MPEPINLCHIILFFIIVILLQKQKTLLMQQVFFLILYFFFKCSTSFKLRKHTANPTRSLSLQFLQMSLKVWTQYFHMSFELLSQILATSLLQPFLIQYNACKSEESSEDGHPKISNTFQRSCQDFLEGSKKLNLCATAYTCVMPCLSFLSSNSCPIKKEEARKKP